MKLEDCEGCKVDYCSSQYTEALDAEKVDSPEPTETYCKILRNFGRCLRMTAKECHGNIPYHTSIVTVKQLSKENNCETLIGLEKSFLPAGPPLLRPSIIPKLPSNTVPVSVVTPRSCTFLGRNKFRYCGLFGDPHLKTFHSKYQTCKLKGAWPLIDNPYLAVSVTNEPVIENSPATVTTKIILEGVEIIKNHHGCHYWILGVEVFLSILYLPTKFLIFIDSAIVLTTKEIPSEYPEDGFLKRNFFVMCTLVNRCECQVTVIIKGRGTFCTQEKTYEAQADQPLQASFVDGTHMSGPNASVVLKLEEIDKNHQVVEIYLKYIETTLVIRQVGKYLAFAARLPEEVALLDGEDLQLCNSGCPTSEQLNLAADHGEAMSWEEALSQCQDSDGLSNEINNRLTDHYLDWCVFDVMTTGEVAAADFMAAAHSAQADVLRFDPESLRNRTTTKLRPRDVTTLPTSGARSYQCCSLRILFVITVIMIIVK
ncbi:hypothetical protein RUM44_005644 [Polyplax serrata]|uniref:Repulsive guidance molecule A n=1 Tax=Polyplax serrata TaxID=468196 RepID=A0ABR1ADZ2_POLSC